MMMSIVEVVAVMMLTTVVMTIMNYVRIDSGRNAADIMFEFLSAIPDFSSDEKPSIRNWQD